VEVRKVNGVIYYFSGTGNTKWAADKFKEKFKDNNIDIDLVSIENTQGKDINEYDLLIFGTPVYADVAPKIFKDFIKGLPSANREINCLLYCTLRAKKAGALDIIRIILESKGYKVCVQDAIQMPNNYFFRFGKEPSESSIKELTEKAENKIENLVNIFIKGKRSIKSVFPVRIGISKILGQQFLKLLPRMSNNLTSTSDCIKCGMCLRNCPKGNITFEEGHAIFHSNCMMCVRCIHICPRNGIRFKGKKIHQTQKKFINTMVIR
jgi:ferredoxin